MSTSFFFKCLSGIVDSTLKVQSSSQSNLDQMKAVFKGHSPLAAGGSPSKFFFFENLLLIHAEHQVPYSNIHFSAGGLDVNFLF